MASFLTPKQISVYISQIYELFGNVITIDDINIRGIQIITIIIQSKIIIKVIDSYKFGIDINPEEYKSLKIIKDRLKDLIDRCFIIIGVKDLKKIMRLIIKLCNSKNIDKKTFDELKDNLDLGYIYKYIQIITDFGIELCFDEADKNVLLYLKKCNLYIANALVNTRLSDKDIGNQTCFTQFRDLTKTKEYVNKTIQFINTQLDKTNLKNISNSIYKEIKN